MKNQHTHGPWAVSPQNNITSRNGTVAKTEQMPGNYKSEQKANAHLIAAAPDLLSALQECVRVLAEYTQYEDDDGSAESNARLLGLAAISKAEGEK